MLDAVLPQYVHFQVYQMILNARASEHSARMVAMKNAYRQRQADHQDLTLDTTRLAGGHHHRTAGNHQRADGAGLIELPP